jgi:hypothetical protein
MLLRRMRRRPFVRRRVVRFVTDDHDRWRLMSRRGRICARPADTPRISRRNEGGKRLSEPAMFTEARASTRRCAFRRQSSRSVRASGKERRDRMARAEGSVGGPLRDLRRTLRRDARIAWPSPQRSARAHTRVRRLRPRSGAVAPRNMKLCINAPGLNGEAFGAIGAGRV